MTQTGTWEAPRGPGPTKLVAGIPLLLTGALLLAVLPLATDDAAADERVVRALPLLAAGLVVLGLLLAVLGARARLWRRRVARHGVRAEGVVVGSRNTLVKTSQHGGEVARVTVRLDDPGGPGEVVVREVRGVEDGRRVVVRYDAGRPARAVLMGKAKRTTDPGELAALAASWADGHWRASGAG